MRVLFINENIGGHATVHLHLEAELAARADVDAAFFDVPAPGLVRRLLGARVPGLAHLDLDLAPLRAQVALSFAVRRFLRHEATDFDALHVYTQNAALTSVRYLRRKPSAVSTDSTNALNAYRLPQRKPTRWTPRVLKLTQVLERRVYRAATVVVANSEYVARSLRVDYGVPEDRLQVQPMGIPIPELPVASSALAGEPASVPRIVFVGRQLERKGGRRLIRLHQERLVGRCVLDLVTPEDVDSLPNIRVHRNVTPGDGRLDAILAGAAVFVFPSEIDQAPNAVLEAMAMGLPVVALRVGAVPEMVVDRVTGFLVDPSDDDGLVRAVETLLDNPELRAQMGPAARDRALAHYDITRTTDSLLEILEDARRRFVSR